MAPGARVIPTAWTFRMTISKSSAIDHRVARCDCEVLARYVDCVGHEETAPEERDTRTPRTSHRCLCNLRSSMARGLVRMRAATARKATRRPRRLSDERRPTVFSDLAVRRSGRE